MLLDAVFALEALDPPRSIDQALLAGVKRMTFRAHFHVQFPHGGTRLKRISACAAHYASVVFGMNCSFHLTSLRRPLPTEGYHPRHYRTIDLRGRFKPLIVLGLIMAALVIGATFAKAQSIASQVAAPAPTGSAAVVCETAGFAPPQRTLFAPILRLAPPGPHRAERAMTLLDRQIAFQFKALRPEFSPQLDALTDKIPTRQSTLIRAASYYSRADIPWHTLPNGTHEVCVEGYPSGDDFYLTTSPECAHPNEPFRLGAYFALKPPPGVKPVEPLPAVIGTLGGELETDTFGLGAMIDAAAGAIGETYGDMCAPWDTDRGRYNHHDAASRERFRRDLPSVDAKLQHYFNFNNVLDEFDGPGGPWVLFNFIGEVKPDALKKYEHLYKFYTRIAPMVRVGFDVMDGKGDYWMRGLFDRGKFNLVFMIRNGKLSAFGPGYAPVGEPLAFDRVAQGVHRSRTWVRVTRFAMDFGLDNLSFTNYFTRQGTNVTFSARMDAVPQVIAPVGVKQAATLVAGEFMTAMAQGAGGLRSQLSSQEADGRVLITTDLSAEFMYSPTLEFLARIGDSIAAANNADVRKDERKLGEELLNAFLTDYNNARPKILALDQDPALTR